VAIIQHQQLKTQECRLQGLQLTFLARPTLN